MWMQFSDKNDQLVHQKITKIRYFVHFRRCAGFQSTRIAIFPSIRRRIVQHEESKQKMAQFMGLQVS